MHGRLLKELELLLFYRWSALTRHTEVLIEQLKGPFVLHEAMHECRLRGLCFLLLKCTFLKVLALLSLEHRQIPLKQLARNVEWFFITLPQHGHTPLDDLQLAVRYVLKFLHFLFQLSKELHKFKALRVFLRYLNRA